MKSVVKKAVYSCLILSGALMLLTLYFYCYYTASSNIKEKDINNPEEEATRQQEAMAGIEKQQYKVILENGSINVYHMPDNELYLNTEIDADTLEQSDREQLVNGIYMDDLKRLFSYLQTLTS